MIGYVRGELLSRGERGALVLTPGGVGYEIRLPASASAALPARGEVVEFYVHTVVREDAIDLYGFSSLDDRAVFETLLGISKLGPKTALAILSVYDATALRGLAAGNDPDLLARVPGIGKKSAQRIFVELKYKLDMGGGPAAMPAPGGGATVFSDALAGLCNLGYGEAQAASVLRAALDEEPDLDVSQALRQALKRLAKDRA
ncbi:Holliday junction branch migration protein RuvA [Desulfolutivibrio sulfoxidireducens]|uniref:Holliday junction branch migration protein RuvA n=1 Tax=Desulfolutivibrio sulfoxidireducens TaxID=2773299 RepID=UPI00159D6438|nr:Holliday junction branch migration protein RuvA [Desulfolutivibrio sulfoxidireducens]QLA16118.1 Holliday junction branch migration protein RuvA [Desulfolutivibrio sulfoxidireducens]